MKEWKTMMESNERRENKKSRKKLKGKSFRSMSRLLFFFHPSRIFSLSFFIPHPFFQFFLLVISLSESLHLFFPKIFPSFFCCQKSHSFQWKFFSCLPSVRTFSFFTPTRWINWFPVHMRERFEWHVTEFTCFNASSSMVVSRIIVIVPVMIATSFQSIKG